MPNHLATEKSPYLRQHASNPVDWYAWGEDAFARARAEDKPLLVSIGYSSCHWCHVMAHESFENLAVAGLMNGSFVNVKVDREERPDVDAVYMEAVQMMTGQGGWPLNVFLTPDLKPFFGGTYWPPAPRHGLPSWTQVLQSIALAWRNERPRVIESAASLTGNMAGSLQLSATSTQFDARVLDEAAASLVAQLDPLNGGFGGAPKFPQPCNLEFLLRTYARTGAPDMLRAVTVTLDHMAAGGIHDQIGGGFHRYSVDATWTVPHFEKMLYDNALLSALYVYAWQATKETRYRDVAEDSLDYLLRDMRSPEGGFYSAEDADSEGGEGCFYLWTPDVVRSVLSGDEAAAALKAYGITAEGNFEGRSIPTRRVSLEGDQRAILQQARKRMLDARTHRPQPERDEKILTGWNGLAIRSFVLAGRTFGREDYLQAAEVAARFLLDALCDGDRLLHLYNGGPASIPAYLDDHAFLIEALTALYETTGEARWLDHAGRLATMMVMTFEDRDRGGFFDVEEAAAGMLPVRPKSLFDSVMPAGGSAAAMALLRLAALTGEENFVSPALRSIGLVRDALGGHAGGFGYLLSALDFHLHGNQEIVVVGPADRDDTRDMLSAIFERFLPLAVTAHFDPAASHPDLPVFQDRELIGGRATAYVCRSFACDLPATDLATLTTQLNGLSSAGVR